MSLFDRLRAFGRRPMSTLGDARPAWMTAVAGVTEQDRRGLVQWLEQPGPRIETPQRVTGMLTDADKRAMYEQSALVRAVVDEKANELVTAPWGIVGEDADDDVPVWTEQRIRRVFARPNTTDGDYVQMLRAGLIDLFTLDAMALEILRGDDGQPCGLVALDGSTIQPQLDVHGACTGYVQRLQQNPGRKPNAVFGVQDICYVKANPVTYRRYGLGYLDSLVLDVGADLLAMRRNRDFFTSGLHVDKMLAVKDAGVTALTDMRAYFEDIKGKGHKLPVIGADASILNLRDTNRDMEFMAFEEWILRRICAVYQVSVDRVLPVFALQTKAGGETQAQTHAEKSDQVVRALVAGAFTTQIVAPMAPGAAFAFREAPLDGQARALYIQTLQQAGYPYNRILESLGEEPVLWPCVPGPDGEDVPVCDLPDTALVRAAVGLAGGGLPGSGDPFAAGGLADAPAPSATPFPSFGGSAPGVNKSAGRRPSPVRATGARPARAARATPDPRLRGDAPRLLRAAGAAGAGDAGAAVAGVPGGGEGERSDG